MTLPLGAALALLGALTLYVWLGGADYGGGFWGLLAPRSRRERHLALIEGAIGPVWEANHVWLVAAVVIAFTAFPPAFAWISVSLHIPLAAVLVGIVLRGTSFVFRKRTHGKGARRWGHVFAASSTFTPFALGVSAGAITAAAGPAPAGDRIAEYIAPWFTPFAAAVGGFALALFALLAATYLLVEAEDESVARDFRVRALSMAGLVMLLGGICRLSLPGTAPLPAARAADPLGQVLLGSGVFWWGLLVVALLRRWRRIAAAAAIGLTGAVMAGWGQALYPDIIPGVWSIRAAAAPESTLRALGVALAVGILAVGPGFVFLLRTFKTDQIGRRAKAS